MNTFFISLFSCQNLSSIHASVLHMNGLKVDADYIPELGGFLSRDFGSKYHNLYKDSLSYTTFFRIPFNGRYRQVWLYFICYQTVVKTYFTIENLIHVFWSHDDMNHNYGKTTIMDMENHWYMYNVRKIKDQGCLRPTSGNPKVC